MSLAFLSLFPATHDQILEAGHRTAKQWGKEMTEDEYLERERMTASGEYSSDGKLITWVLAPRNDPTTLQFLCSCETFRRNGLASQGTSNKAGRLVEDVTCYGIASVYTPPSNRGRGYASHMMHLLHWVLAPESSLPEVFPESWGLPPTRVASAGNAAFSALWSDIGKEFYKGCGPSPERQGWVVMKPMSTVWDVSTYKNLHPDAPSLRAWSWLEERDVLELWTLDAEKMKDDILSHLSSLSDSNPNRRCCTFLPDNGVGDFQIQRMKFFWEKMDPLPAFWGIYSTNQSRDSNETIILPGTRLKDDGIFASWTLEIRPPSPRTLLITRLRAGKDAFPDLLAKLMSYAAEHGLEKVECWNLPSDLEEVAAFLGGQTFERDEHLSALKWYGDEVVDWLHNEK